MMRWPEGGERSTGRREAVLLEEGPLGSSMSELISKQHLSSHEGGAETDGLTQTHTRTHTLLRILQVSSSPSSVCRNVPPHSKTTKKKMTRLLMALVWLSNISGPFLILCQ